MDVKPLACSDQLRGRKLFLSIIDWPGGNPLHRGTRTFLETAAINRVWFRGSLLAGAMQQRMERGCGRWM